MRYYKGRKFEIKEVEKMKFLNNSMARLIRVALYFAGAAVVAAKASNSVKIEYLAMVALAVFLFVCGAAAIVTIFRPDLS